MPQWGSAQKLVLAFDVLPVSKEIGAWRKLLPYAGAFIVFFAAYWVYSWRRLKAEQRQKVAAQLRLKSLRAQLNPHFMFNALSSVQNLMNKNDLLEANRYLSRFAGLTRAVLNATEQEMISLQEDLVITEDYLLMEQLRFGFRYELNVTGDFNVATTEVPAMLLQPFIENAVKHGVAGMREQGRIGVNVTIEKDNLILSVSDNGPGFDTSVARKDGSFGLKLSAERIAALNQVYKNSVLNISSVPGFTEVKIWISEFKA